MDLIFEIIKITVTNILTGIITFLITRYTCNRNVPLDKFEKAYNRVYYPIFQLIKNEKDKNEIAQKSELYIKKYGKYVDRSTIKALNYFIKMEYNNKSYENFINNIYSMNTKLRRKLGYLEPNILSIYNYSAPYEKRMIRICIEIFGCYLSVIIISFGIHNYIYKAALVIFIISFMALVLDILFAAVINKIISLYEALKNRRQNKK